MNVFLKGFKAMLPITTGVVPFGAVMGTVAADAGLEFYQSFLMNLFVFAGAAQLAAIDLMTQSTASVVVVATGLIINLRFLLYSAAFSPLVQNSKFITKFACAYSLTDQTYAAMLAHQKKLNNQSESLQFYLGASLCMFLAWQISVIAGFVFGNFAPKALALDYAVPLSFVALVMPTFKSWKYIAVAVFSSNISLLLTHMPFRLGLIATTALSICFAVVLTRKK